MASKRKRAAEAECDRTSVRNMAAVAAHLQSLKEEATCSICLEYFTDPVFMECGHTFCQSCITQCWKGLQTDFPCPQCKEISPNKTLRLNRHLADMVEIIKKLQISTETPQEVNLCREHEEKLKLFCEEDQKPICVVCGVSRDHKPHTVLPIREAAQEYKEKFQSYLDSLEKKLKDVLKLHRKEETKVRHLESQFKSQRERIHNEFEKLQTFLENEKMCRLSTLEKEEKKSLQSIKEAVNKLEDQQSVLSSLIREIDVKCQQEDVEILKDVKSTLSRYENVKAEHAAYDTSTGIKEMTNKEKEVDLHREIIESLAAVTLDPDTALSQLILSEDGRSVRTGDKAQDLPDTPQRFTKYLIVLGRERLSSGKHYWEVEVGDKTGWALGVCDEAVSRKDNLIFAPEGGFWTVRLSDGEYEALTDPPTLLTPCVPPRVVGLFLDYGAGRLSVYNVDDRSLLFTFSGATSPPTLRPFFNPGFNDKGMNAGPVQILPVTGGSAADERDI
ncbi:E3 ubiquitin-protein ligase TRIM39-like isoform X2 [Lissotriton helveticus]